MNDGPCLDLCAVIEVMLDEDTDNLWDSSEPPFVSRLLQKATDSETVTLEN